jgi:hypothetical protein
MKIRPVGADLFLADRRTDERTDKIVAFRNFMNVPVSHEEVWESAGSAECDISG